MSALPVFIKRVVSSVPISLELPIAFDSVGHSNMPPLATNSNTSIIFCEMNSVISGRFEEDFGDSCE